jgi:hypothetical protein
MVRTLFDVLKLYEEDGLKLEPWYSLSLNRATKRRIGYDPSRELDWRNQGSAHADCLLKYMVRSWGGIENLIKHIIIIYRNSLKNILKFQISKRFTSQFDNRCRSLRFRDFSKL